MDAFRKVPEQSQPVNGRKFSANDDDLDDDDLDDENDREKDLQSQADKGTLFIS